ncbi:MAG: hypothetical protein NTU84_00640 [Verrucomicrobia bacterium]|nr:hypothetical protein [Verrucomicrobiota bacterium]
MSWIAVGTLAVGATTAAVSAKQQSKAAKSQANAIKANQVKPPNVMDDARRAWIEQYNLAPTVARRDMQIRQQMAPQQAQLASDLYKQYLPQFAQTNMRTLQKIDPESIAGRKALYGTVLDELQAGRSMTPETTRQITQAARGALAARGNNLGNAAALAEATNYGAAADNALQQRIVNMGNFLRGPTPQSQFAELAGGASPAIGGMLSAAVSPGAQYVEGPSYWRNAADAAWRQYSAEAGNAEQAGQADAMAAGAQENPWLAALGGAAGAYMSGVSTGAIRTGTGAGVKPKISGANLAASRTPGTWQNNAY